MGIGEDDLLNCSVTVMPILGNKIGFLRRDIDDSHASLLLAPGGSMETPDGEDIEGVKYYSTEATAVREMWEKTGIRISRDKLKYFCSMTLPTLRVTISFYCEISNTQIGRSLGYLEFYNKEEITKRNDFGPGMKQEALKLLEFLDMEAGKISSEL